MDLSFYLAVVGVALCFSASQGNQSESDVFSNDTTCRHQLPTVAMDEQCSKEVRVDGALVIVPNRHPYYLLPSCMNCSVTLVASPDHQIVTTLYLLGTKASEEGKCDLNRLDIYDGESEQANNRLSGEGGICGCKLPSNGGFKSTNNTLTLHFQTKCAHTQHGELQLVVTAVKNDMFNITGCEGKFECKNGQCIDKNLVCNGKYNCHDHSDEKDCLPRNDTCPGQFQCLNENCIDKNLVCNGHNNCPDGSDEKGCRSHGNSTCVGKFECKNGHCIDKNQVCNGEDDCGDKSDETGCHIKISRILLYVLIGLAALIAILLIVVVIILCCKYCCITFKMASVYRRLS